MWPATFLVYFVRMYSATICHEEAYLDQRFGDAYREYRARVPAVVPRLRAYRGSSEDRGGFDFAQYGRNEEWYVLLGTAAALAWLAVKPSVF